MNTTPPPPATPAGFWAYLREFWALVLVTNRYALTARFCVIAGLAAAVALLTVDQGREMLRALAEPRAFTFFPTDGSGPNAASLPGRPGLSELAWHHFGWFSFATIVLSLACWASTRLCYGLLHETEKGENLRLEKLIERKLPMYFGALPLIVAGCGFLQEAFTYLPENVRPPGLALIIWAVPLGLLFGVPALIIVRWLVLRPSHQRLARSAPGLRYLLYLCAALPALAVLFLYIHRDQLSGGPGVASATLFAAEYFFLLAIGIYHWEMPWIIALPGVALLLIAFAFHIEDPHDQGSVVAAGAAHLLLSIFVWHIAVGRMQTRLLLSEDLNFGQVVKMIFFGPAPRTVRVGPMERTTLRAAGVVSIILLVVLISIWKNPQGLPRLIGPAAVLSLALTAWVVLGNGLLVATRAAHLPLILFAMFWALVCSICQDNHVIRLSPPSPGLAPATGSASSASAVAKPYADVGALFADWHQRVQERYPLFPEPPGKPPQKRPCFIIATEGGGIRAAFWTAQVLTRLEKDSREKAVTAGTPDFASHILAISGVSGGSLGASVFDALYAELDKAQHPEDPENARDLAHKAAFILGSDHLSPLVGAMLFPDTVQCFCPWTLPGTDRGSALEHSWENRWQFYVGAEKNRFREPFLDLWKDHRAPATTWLPALFLNATRVEDGHRIIVSNVKINSGPTGDFPDALDLHDYLWSESNVVHGPWERLARLWRGDKRTGMSTKLDLPLSTATHCSARFTYFSPAARLPSGQRVVDGGYYENSGGETARDILAAVDKVIHQDPARYPVEPIILLIRYIDRDDLNQQGFHSLVPGSSPATASSYALSDLLSPLLALMNVRSAHATDEYAGFGQLWASPPQDEWHQAYPFQLAQRQVPLPLGWMLCGRSAGEMVTEMPDANSVIDLSSSPTLSANHEHLLDVLDCLGRMKPH